MGRRAERASRRHRIARCRADPPHCPAGVLLSSLAGGDDHDVIVRRSADDELLRWDPDERSMKPLMAPGASPQRPSGDQPARRPIQIYSFDPMLANTLERIGPAKVTVGIPWEPLKPGPSGARVQVVDFDGGRMEGGTSAPRFYEPVDLRTEELAAQGGLPPTEGDPRFHQQMVYAVAMRIVRGVRQGPRSTHPAQGRAPAAAPARVPRAERVLRPGKALRAVRLLHRRHQTTPAGTSRARRSTPACRTTSSATR